ncbi:hypothetical protein Ahy_B05g078420 [Arachis hypogaea]|uniref:Aminotransferase-like plant mobile domain-containing protein n=1 Tax=Arachis hypogaea TaxID=3818 RepID=A0A444Z727_ARAHY|nr:hypothetical protein Ahy_B05g078420 [Arachis hypogaea]
MKLAGPLQLLQSWIFWHFPGFRPAGYDTFSWPLASRWSGHNPSACEKGPRFIWMPYSSPDVLQVAHPEVLEPRHTALWWCVTPRPQPALNIDFLMSKDGRGGDCWFPYSLQFWHLHWESRADRVLRFDVVADPGPSHDFLEWWGQHGVGLSGKLVSGHDGASVSGGGLTKPWRRVTLWGGMEADNEDMEADAGPVLELTITVFMVTMVTMVISMGLVGERLEAMIEEGAGDGGLGSGPLGDYFVGVSGDDHAVHESQIWVSPRTLFSDLLVSDGLDVEFGSSHFLDKISAIMQEDDVARRQA